jgi:hypothetical protein
METQRTVAMLNGRKVWITNGELEAIRTFEECRKGGMATIHGYIPNDRKEGGDWITAPVQDISVLTRFSYKRLAERKLAVLEGLSLDDARIQKAIAADPKLSEASRDKLEAAWADRLERARNTVEKLAPDADRDDAHRQAHDADYWPVSEGVKVHFVTEPTTITVDGAKKTVKRPVLTDGLPTVASVMLSVIVLETRARPGQEGERYVPNSGIPVRLGNAISRAVNQPGLSFRTVSLKPGRWESISIDTHRILTEDVHRNVEAVSDAPEGWAMVG